MDCEWKCKRFVKLFLCLFIFSFSSVSWNSTFDKVDCWLTCPVPLE